MARIPVNHGNNINRPLYDPSGNLTNLLDGKTNSTVWKYDQYSRLTNKLDNLGTNLFVYKYDADNRLTNRTSAAKGTTGYRYDAVGNLTNIVYPTSTNILVAYDALNRLTNMVDALGVTHYSYDAVGQVLSEDGPWASDTVNYTYNNRLRASLSLQAPNAPPWTQNYAYDTARRLTSITSPAGTFGYQYAGSQPSTLISRLALPNGAYITNIYDSSARLLSTALRNSTNGLLNSHDYLYNLGNQRTQQLFTAGNHTGYTYDKAGQLTSATGIEAGGQARYNERPGYTYDAAGNLKKRTDSSGNSNPLIVTFGVNSLNELTNVIRSGSLTVWGTTTSPATNVAVNTTNADLYADNTFAARGFLPVNGNNTYTAIAKDAYGRRDTNAITVNLLATNVFAYDLNGNLRTNGTRVFDYDDENQLIRITEPSAWKSEFSYDGKMRRRIRKEFTWSSGDWSQTNEVHYIYDGNLVVQERNASNLPQISYTRGRDLSGSREGAGGIGGLLARSDHRLLAIGDSAAHAYYHADGSGNITCLINAGQEIAAKYLYDPFGNTISQSGPLAGGNLYRFSSKETHVNSGFYYYLYRFYDPNFQRWLSRDPLAEWGGFNLYSYVRNDSINLVDPLGLDLSGVISGNPNGLGSGIGSVVNNTGNTYPAAASVGKKGDQEPTTIDPNGVTGGGYGKNPKLNDIDFVYPTPKCPLNTKTNGAFKIGSNMATINPDPKSGMTNNAAMSTYDSYWNQNKVDANSGWMKGIP